MALKTRPVAIAAAVLAVLVIGVTTWQIGSRRPGGTSAGSAEPASTSASGVVTRAVAKPALPAAAVPSEPSAAPPSTAQLAAPQTASAAVPKAPPAVAASTASAIAKTDSAAAAVRHRVAPRPAAQAPILPNEVDAAVAKALGPSQRLARYFYLEPLARRFVSSVDKLGEHPPATSDWLLRPAPGQLRLVPSRAQGQSLLAKANSRRYAGFVRWVESTDSRRLVALYARMYPLLEQTYVELGHPGGYFNDRVIEVIDQLLATPLPKTPPRLKLASAPPATISATPSPPRYEFVDPKLEQLSSGQKMLLRTGPENAVRLQAKLRALRAGLIKLAR